MDLDLEKFFDRVNHDILMGRVAKRIHDKRMLRLLRRYLEAGLMSEGITSPRNQGMPQGGPLSPLLSNLLLDELDQELEKRGHRFCRYIERDNSENTESPPSWPQKPQPAGKGPGPSQDSRVYKRHFQMHTFNRSVLSLSRSRGDAQPFEPPWYGPVCPVVWEGGAARRHPLSRFVCEFVHRAER